MTLMWPLKCAGKFGLNIQSVPTCYNVFFKEKNNVLRNFKRFVSQNFQSVSIFYTMLKLERNFLLHGFLPIKYWGIFH